MDKPTCRLCGSKHYASEPHKFKGDDNNLSEPAPDNPKPTSESKPNPKKKANRKPKNDDQGQAGGKPSLEEERRQKALEAHKRWREANREKLREYKREYMRDYRKGIRRE